VLKADATCLYFLFHVHVDRSLKFVLSGHSLCFAERACCGAGATVICLSSFLFAKAANRHRAYRDGRMGVLVGSTVLSNGYFGEPSHLTVEVWADTSDMLIRVFRKTRSRCLLVCWRSE